MHLREKVQQRFVMRCGKCGYASGNSITSSFSSWLFHEQLCACKEAGSIDSPLIAVASTALDTTDQIRTEEEIDLGKQYEILRVLGKGGMGTVYKAKDKSNGTTVAIKVLREDLLADKNTCKRFEQEALSVSRLHHQNLVAVKTYGQSPTGVPYIVMEYFEGKNLAEVIKERGHLSILHSVQITIQIAEAIEHAHAFSVIHRDIKPSNILLSQEGDHFIVKVVDFGIAKAMPDKQTESAQLTQTGEIFGSPAYMSPEQCLGETIDERSDIYSLGCVVYEMLTGKSPFASDNPVQTVLKHLNDEPEPFEIEFAHLPIPKLLEKVVFKCLQKDSAKRYATIYELSKELQQLGSHPASVGKRFAAATLDLILLVPFIFAFTWFLFTLVMPLVPVAMSCDAGCLMYSVIASVIFYLASFESAPCRGTPGMLILDLRVTNMQGRRISWLSSAIRAVSLVGTLMAIWVSYWLFQSTLVLLGVRHVCIAPASSCDTGLVILVGMSCALYWLLIAFSKNYISPIDRLFDRIVTYRNVLSPNHTSSHAPTATQWSLGLVATASMALTPWISENFVRIGTTKQWPAVYIRRDIHQGEIISADALEVRMVSNNDLPANAIETIAEARGKVAASSFSAGQLLFTFYLASDGTNKTSQSGH